MEEILHKFGIDWKLLLAQGVNFFILFFILKKFVYQPLLAVLHKRKREIEKGVEFTQKAEESFKSADAVKTATIAEAKNQALSIVTQAENSANVRKEEILTEAAAKRDGVIAEARGIIDEHKNKMLAEVHADAEGLLRLALEKVLRRMPPADRDASLIKDALAEAKRSLKS